MLRRRYITRAADTDVETAEIFGMACGELIDTICHNWQPAQDDKWLQLLVYNRAIHPDLLPEARAQIEDGARALAEQVDQWLYECEKRSKDIDDDADRVEVGLGLYYFQ